MGIGDDTTAARRLRLLQREFTQPERRPEPGARRTAPTATAPLNLGIVDYIGAAVAEVEQHTRSAAPDAGDYLGDAAGVYDWMREHTAHLDDERQATREQVIYRQSLEHAILMGNDKVVRPHRCPECQCFGLLWDSARRKAVCSNLDCVDDRGLTNAWSLNRLAFERITAEKKLNSRAT